MVPTITGTAKDMRKAHPAAKFHIWFEFTRTIYKNKVTTQTDFASTEDCRRADRDGPSHNFRIGIQDYRMAA